MPDKPAAEVTIDAALVRHLVVTQAGTEIADAATLPLTKTAEGWDCEVWRLGASAAVRLPRRALAAPLIVHEQRVLPLLAPGIEARGVRVPAPIFAGAPDERFPWPWSIVPWIEGAPGLGIRRSERLGWAQPLADALGALHVAAPADYPPNPFRGVPLIERSEAVAQRLDDLRGRGAIDRRQADATASVWGLGLAAAAWSHRPVWIHGDLHPGNLVADGGRLTGIIDFGDVTAGDPAYDLAVAWLAFDDAGRARFIDATGSRYDDATWVRAHAWAAAVAMMLLTHSDDEPAYAALGREALAEVTAAALSA